MENPPLLRDRGLARINQPIRCLILIVAVIVTDPLIYLSDTTWLRRFGEPCLTFVESTADGNFRERRVFFRRYFRTCQALLPVTRLLTFSGLYWLTFASTNGLGESKQEP